MSRLWPALFAAAACGAPTPPATDDPYADARAALVERLREQGIGSEAVLAAIGRVPRHELVPQEYRDRAYANRPLPIGWNQTISQPYVVALMTQLLELEAGERVLEIGTGSGYQAAVLAELGVEVWSIEIVEPLGERAARDLERLGYGAVHLRIGDGYVGWPEAAPFDAIVLTAAPPAIPAPLREQLRLGGRLVAPVGVGDQQLVVLERTEEGFRELRSARVRFVPMTGRAQE
jgi:protein-L-isoaspartate(D-aspartate) O-methyltransferase